MYRFSIRPPIMSAVNAHLRPQASRPWQMRAGLVINQRWQTGSYLQHVCSRRYSRGCVWKNNKKAKQTLTNSCSRVKGERNTAFFLIQQRNVNVGCQQGCYWPMHTLEGWLKWCLLRGHKRLNRTPLIFFLPYFLRIDCEKKLATASWFSDFLLRIATKMFAKRSSIFPI